MVKDSEKWKNYYEKNVAMGMRNQMLRLRVRKLEQSEAILVARMEHPIVLDRTSEIL